LQRFLQGPGDAHAYMVHVGAGWAMARTPWGMAYFNKLNSLLGWLALDGYGFHQGYFNWPKYVTRQQLPGNLTAYQQRAFDQGLGRSLWFSKGTQIELMTAQIAYFALSRQSDLWSGLGLAAAYAGGVNEAGLASLKNSAGSYFPHFAQGVTFAAKTRLRAGNSAEHTESACRIICEMSMDKAAKLTDDALIALPEDDDLPAYEHWRQRIQQNFIN
jgi:enediyne biosynthesis protein E3